MTAPVLEMRPARLADPWRARRHGPQVPAQSDRSAARCLVWLVLAVTLAAGTPDPSAARAAATGEVDGPTCPSPRGVVVIVIDALRADGLGVGGNPRPTSPAIDALAAKSGTVFRNAVAPAPWTLPSMASMLTSLSPAIHGADSSSDMRVWMTSGFRPTTILDDSRTTLPEILDSAGIRTAAFVNGSYPGRAFGIDQGFEVFADNTRPGVRFNVADALRWIDRVWPARFFIYLHVIEVHSPYRPRSDRRFSMLDLDPTRRSYGWLLEIERERYLEVDWDPDYSGAIDGSWQSLRRATRGWWPPGPADRRHVRALYDRGIRYADAWVGEFLDGLRSRQMLDETAVLITADHGEELFEHGGVEHGPTYFDEVMRIPLILHLPGQTSMRLVEEQVSLLDVTPTVLDLFGLATDAGPGGAPMEGRSLLPAVRGESLGDRTMYGEAATVPGLVALRTPTEKLILQTRTGDAQLFDLRDDPGEIHDVCGERSERCRALATELHDRRRRQAEVAHRLALPVAERAVVDEATRERLRALGYAGD